MECKIYFINSIEDYHKVKKVFSSNKNLIFRGHQSKDYRLIPSLYRPIFEKDIEKDLKERRIINTFFVEDDNFKYLKKYLCKNEENDIFYLYRLQHYGIATRLLDFTRNFDIALCFATSNFYEECFDNSNQDAEIVILDKNKYVNLKNNDGYLLNELIFNYNQDDVHSINLDDKFFAEYPNSPTYYEYPKSFIDDRIKKQEACFIIFPHAFSNNLEIEKDKIFARVIISKTIKAALYKLNTVKVENLK